VRHNPLCRWHASCLNRRLIYAESDFSFASACAVLFRIADLQVRFGASILDTTSALLASSFATRHRIWPS